MQDGVGKGIKILQLWSYLWSFDPQGTCAILPLKACREVTVQQNISDRPHLERFIYQDSFFLLNVCTGNTEQDCHSSSTSFVTSCPYLYIIPLLLFEHKWTSILTTNGEEFLLSSVGLRIWDEIRVKRTLKFKSIHVSVLNSFSRLNDFHIQTKERVHVIACDMRVLYNPQKCHLS